MQAVIKKEERMSASWERVISILPKNLALELEHMRKSHKRIPAGINELRLRGGGVSSLLIDGSPIPLAVRVGEDELEDIIFKACDGSLYAYRDTLAQGYIPMGEGIRLGICGHARYEGGTLVGVSGVSALVFRMPFGECLFAEDIASIFLSGSHSGMLIYAPPGGGKTTALRSLVKVLGSGRTTKRICVIDERCEFLPEDYIRCTVDLLRGYKRAQGIELAVRTLNPEIIVIDEITSEDAASLEGVIRCGIPIIATAHASGMEELLAKPYINKFTSMGAFDLLVGITKSERDFGFIATDMKV